MRHFPRHQDDVSEYLLCSPNQNDVHNNQYQKRNKKQTPPPKKKPKNNKNPTQITFMYPVVVAITSFQPTVSLTTMGFHGSW